MIDTFVSPTYRDKAYEAARAYAAEDKSDPFCAGRILNEMRCGLALASDVLADARRLGEAREARMAAEQERNKGTVKALKLHLGLGE